MFRFKKYKRKKGGICLGMILDNRNQGIFANLVISTSINLQILVKNLDKFANLVINIEIFNEFASLVIIKMISQLFSGKDFYLK